MNRKHWRASGGCAVSTAPDNERAAFRYKDVAGELRGQEVMR